jgi:hypothetical protein
MTLPLLAQRIDPVTPSDPDPTINQFARRQRPIRIVSFVRVQSLERSTGQMDR